MAGTGEDGVCSDCLKWSKKYSKVEGGRNALRETVKILDNRLDNLIQQNSAFKKELEVARSMSDHEVRVALEKEIAELKSEIHSLKESRRADDNAAEQVSCLQISVYDYEKEVLQFKELVNEEKSRAEAALGNLQVEKTKAAEALKAVKLEKSKAEKERMRACAESKRVKEYKIQIDALKTEAAEARSQLALAKSKCEEANARLEAEVKEALALEKEEVKKQKTLLHVLEKKLAEGKCCADTLSFQLDVERKKNEEMRKTLSELMSSKKVVDGVAQKKIAKTQHKLAKSEVNFQRICNVSQKKELDMLKQEFFQFSNRLDFLDRSLSCNTTGVDDSDKVQGISCLQMHGKKVLGKPLQNEIECVTKNFSNHAGQPSKHATIPPLSGIILPEYTTGISEKNPPAGNFDEDLFDSSAIDSSRAPFSNCEFVVTQENLGSSTPSSNLYDGINMHLAGSRICGEVIGLMQSVKPLTVANNDAIRHNSAVSDGDRVHCKKRKRIHSLIDSVQYAFSETKMLHTQMEETVSNLDKELQSSVYVSKDVAHNNSRDESKKITAADKQKASSQCLQDETHVVEPDGTEFKDGTVFLGTDIFATVPANDLSNVAPVCKATNVVKFTENGHSPSECLDDIAHEDYMKLLDLTDPEDEKHYRVARDHLLSPSLPVIDFQSVDAFSLDEVDLAILAVKDVSVVGLSTANCGLRVSDLVQDTPATHIPPVKEDKTNVCYKASEFTKQGLPILEADVSNLIGCGTTVPCEILLNEYLASFGIAHSDKVEAVSLDAVLFLLLERLKFLMEKAETHIGSNGISEESPNPKIPYIRKDLVLEDIFSQFSDALTLVELIAKKVSWEILANQAVPQLLLMLESCTLDIFSMAIVVFLGQLGRILVTACGPQDTGVDRLRCGLSAMLGCDKGKSVMLPIQIAIVPSLSELNLDYNSLVEQCADINSSNVEASSACLIRSWFNSLSKEQQSFTLRFLRNECS